MFSYDPRTKVLSGIEIPPFYDQNVCVGEVIMHYLQREPGKVVQTNYDDGVEITAGEMAKLGSRIARNIIREGFQVGEVIGLVAKNTTYVAPLVLGCLLAGCPISTLDPTFDVSEIANIFSQTKPQLVFCDHDIRDVVCDAMQRCGNDNEILTVDEKLTDTRYITELLELPSGEREFMRSRSFDIESAKMCAVILCSSGTTGLSKGTMISSAQCLQMIRPFPQLLSPTVFCFSSLYWLSGLTTLLYTMGNCCKRIITKRKFSPLLIVHLVEKYKVNVLLTPPSQVAMLLQSPVLKLADLSSIRMYLVGGGFMAQNLRTALQEHLLFGAMIFTYGMTEIAGLVASTLPFQKTSNGSGKIAPNTKIKIIDDDGNTMNPNEIGEIYVMTAVRFLGYADNPEGSRNAFDNMGWLKTGDLGYFTEKEGDVYVVDRKKEMIKYLNYQVAPSEIETCVQKMEGVKQVCIVGIPDIISGDLAAAVIVKANNSFLTEQDVVDEVARNFPQFKRLHGGAYFVDSLPFTASGKIKKMIVKKIATKLYKSREINGNY